MSENEQSHPDPQSSRPSVSAQRQGTGLEPDSAARSKRVFAWTGAVVIFLLLVLPTLGSHGTHQRFYDGDQFICFSALGPTTSYPAGMFEEHEYETNTGSDIGIAATRDGKVTRYETERTFRVAVCGEQRSRRVGWALVLTVPTLLLGFSARDDRIRARSEGSPQSP